MPTETETWINSFLTDIPILRDIPGFSRYSHFISSQNNQKSKGFLVFLGGIKWEYRQEI